VHAIAALAARKDVVKKLGDKTWSGVQVTGVREAVVVWPVKDGAFAYRVPRAAAVTHVVLGGGELSATAEGDQCAVSVKPGHAVVAMLDDACKVTVDPEGATAGPALTTRPPPIRPRDSTRRSGCCGAQTTPGSPIAMTFVVGWILLRRASRRGRRADRSASSRRTV
jgi:hypothetical protein